MSSEQDKKIPREQLKIKFWLLFTFLEHIRTYYHVLPECNVQKERVLRSKSIPTFNMNEHTYTYTTQSR